MIPRYASLRHDRTQGLKELKDLWLVTSLVSLCGSYLLEQYLGFVSLG